jgi:hypothetical protein
MHRMVRGYGFYGDGGASLRRSAAGIPIAEAYKTNLLFQKTCRICFGFFAAGQVGHCFFLKKNTRLFFSFGGGLIFALSFVPHCKWR